MKRVRNTVLNRDRERVLSRIATRGVVKFFNVVQTQQKDIEVKLKEAGPYERRIDKVYNSIDRKSFLEKLKESNNGDNDDFDDMDKEKSKKPTWNVLREDFLMDGEMKNWDKHEDDEDDDDDDEDEDDDDDEEEERNVKVVKNKKNNNKNSKRSNLKNRNKKFKK